MSAHDRKSKVNYSLVCVRLWLKVSTVYEAIGGQKL